MTKSIVKLHVLHTVYRRTVVRESDRSRTDKDLDSGKRKAVTLRDHVKPHVLHTVPTELLED